MIRCSSDVAVVTFLTLASIQFVAAQQITFEVASLKPRDVKVSLGLIGMQRSPGRLTNRCATLRSLLFYAYGLMNAKPIVGLPDWASVGCGPQDASFTYDFDARMPAETTDTQARVMLQAFLKERFGLAVHWEKQNRPVQLLVVSESGFKLKPSDPKDDPPRAPGSLGCPVQDRACGIAPLGSSPMSRLADMLSSVLERPVVDETGLTGTYYLDLKWAGQSSVDSPLPSLPTLLKESFGLELKSATRPVDVLVVDQARVPSPN